MKKFLIKIGYTVFPLWLALIGTVCIYNIIIIPYMQGDLGRLGKIPMKLYYERDSDQFIHETLYSTIFRMDSISSDTFNIMTCGDSFSSQGLYGYQNYMSLHGFHIINYYPYGPLRWNSFQSAYDLMNLGYVDSSKVKVLVIESVERYLFGRLSNLEFTHKKLAEKDEDINHTKDDVWSLSEAKTYLDFQLGLKNDENPVKQLELKKQLFSGTRGRSLYFYYHDITQGFSIPKESYNQVRANIDSLYDKAASKGIELLILICPDKYDMYQDYVENNPYPRKSINEDFRKIVGCREDIIIGKEVLLPYIQSGEKDMYYFDDSHWSYKSAKIIADTLTNLYLKHHIGK